MDKRDLGLLMIVVPYIILAVKTSLLYIGGVANPLDIYRNVGSDPILFLVNLVIYLIGAYLLVGYASPDIRDILINIIFFAVPFITLIFIIAYLWVYGGATGLILLYSTAQFPLYHIFLVSLAGVIILAKKSKLNKKEILLVTPFIGIIAIYALIRLYAGIVAVVVFTFVVIVGILSIYIAKKFY